MVPGLTFGPESTGSRHGQAKADRRKDVSWPPNGPCTPNSRWPRRTTHPPHGTAKTPAPSPALRPPSVSVGSHPPHHLASGAAQSSWYPDSVPEASTSGREHEPLRHHATPPCNTSDEPRNRRSTHDANIAQQAAWASAMPELQHNAYLAHSNRRAFRAWHEQRLHAEFEDRVQLAAVTLQGECPCCCAPEALHAPPASAPQVLYCSLTGCLAVHVPELLCSSCGACVRVHPVAARCFPATPTRPSIWFSEELMVATAAVRTAGAYAATAWAKALVQMHNSNGFDTQLSTFTHIGSAASYWQVLQVSLTSLSSPQHLLWP